MPETPSQIPDADMISIAIVTDRPLRSGDMAMQCDAPVYGVHPIGSPPARSAWARYHSGSGRWETVTTADVTTAWILFLEPDEYLDSSQWKALRKAVGDFRAPLAEFTIERHLDPEAIQPFGWVTTRFLFEESPADIRRYRTREARLVHRSHLADVVMPSAGCGPATPNGAAVQAPQGHPMEQTALTIRRKPAERKAAADSRPLDYDVFRLGHQVYFDDTVYCERFIWPHSIYHTLRFHYVPSVLSALEQGLCNPEVAHFVLSYLIRFRDFETAWKLLRLLPGHWADRHPMLLVSSGTVRFAMGDRDGAFEQFSRAARLRPDSRLIVSNAIKMCILLGRYDQVKPLEEMYRQQKGELLEDDFISHFRTVHGERPSRMATVSLCMVVRDEEETLARSLSSAREIADEMIVVDTGSRDRSAEIAANAGAKVFQHPWDGDFSTARNFAIEQATGDYILMLDGDEWISPLFYIEGQILKHLLSPERACAYRLSVGYYYNESDWLFLLGEAGNFREESHAVRLFPRLDGIRYSGRIGESIEPALGARGVPIERIPEWSLHILHDTHNRVDRLKRKIDLYDMEAAPTTATVLDAVKDYSYLGDVEKTVQWLRRFYDRPNGDESARGRMGLRLAGLLESMDPRQAERLYDEMLERSRGDETLTRAYASFLIRSNRLEKIGGLPIAPRTESDEPKGAVRMEHNSYAAVKYFEEGEVEKAVSILESVLDESPAYLFGQTIRFYFLVSMGRIDGAVHSLDQLFGLTSGPRSDRVETMEDVLRLITELSDVLLKSGHHRERALVLQGAMALERVLMT